MKNYLVVHYNGITPTFTYTETLDAAKSYALTILSSQQYKSSDVLSIVEVGSDRILYYGKGKKLSAKLSRTGQSTNTIWSGWYQFLRPLLDWMGLKLAKQAV